LPEEREVFLQWMLDQRFKGDHCCILTGPNEGTYCFMKKEDATLFKMWWGQDGW